jgi:hypothetical protein
MAGWYQLADNGARRPLLDGQGDMALAGETVMPLRSQASDPDRAQAASQASPTQPLERMLGDGLVLVGTGLEGDALQAGSSLALNLHWRCDSGNGDCPPDVTGRRMAVSLLPEKEGGARHILWEGPVVPDDAIWRSGEVLCRRLPLHLPGDVEAGRFTLSLETDGVSLPVADLALGPSTRRYDAPPVEREINATLGEAVKLVGMTLEEPDALDQSLRVTLVWQALSSPGADHVVFVHLVDQTGQLVAQSDAAPAASAQPEGYPTSRWTTGEVVLDEHNLALPSDATGSYRLLAGMYDPLTGERLSAQDASGQPIPGGAVLLGDVELR